MNGSLRFFRQNKKFAAKIGFSLPINGIYFTFFFAGNQIALDRMDRRRRKRYHGTEGSVAL